MSKPRIIVTGAPGRRQCRVLEKSADSTMKSR
jgi:hypothetical protein